MGGRERDLDLSREFKRLIGNPESVAGEIVAFANGEGGTLYIGVDDDGSPVSVDAADTAFQTLMNICRDRCIPPVSTTIETPTVAGKQILVLHVAPALNRLKPDASDDVESMIALGRLEYQS